MRMSDRELTVVELANHKRWMKTADGGEITDGVRLFNYYDCFWVEVHFADMDSEFTGIGAKHWDGWFDTRRVNDDGTVGGPRSGPMLNGERMAVRKPAWMK